MKSIILSICAGAALLAGNSSLAGTASPCDKIAQSVRDSVAKDPSKVLLEVEDALVINESCACEIIRSAIVASGADAAMVKQIVETAVAVAPKMTSVIQECASAAGGDVAPVALVSGKSGSGKNGTGVSVQPPKEASTTGGSTFSQGGLIDIRGVYLSMPAAGGFIGVIEEDDDDDDRGNGSGGRTRVKIIRERKIVIVPVSPTRPDPKL